MRKTGKKSQNANLVVRGLKAPNRFEDLKSEGDEAFKLRNFEKAAEIYERISREMEKLAPEKFAQENKEKVYQKSIFSCNFRFIQSKSNADETEKIRPSDSNFNESGKSGSGKCEKLLSIGKMFQVKWRRNLIKEF